MNAIATTTLARSALVTAALLAGAALAALTAQTADETVTLHACYVPASGNVYRIGAEGLPDGCRSPRHVEFSWNERGPAGPQGEPGEDGATGLACWDLDGSGAGEPTEDANGDGDFNALDCRGPAAPFPAAYTTPNGLFSIEVANDGIVLAGPGRTVRFGVNDISIRSSGGLTIQGTTLDLDGDASVVVDGHSTLLEASGGTLVLSGALLRLNGGCSRVARVGDFVHVTAAGGVIAEGSPTVLAC